MRTVSQSDIDILQNSIDIFQEAIAQLEASEDQEDILAFTTSCECMIEDCKKALPLWREPGECTLFFVPVPVERCRQMLNQWLREQRLWLVFGSAPWSDFACIQQRDNRLKIIPCSLFSAFAVMLWWQDSCLSCFSCSSSCAQGHPNQSTWKKVQKSAEWVGNQQSVWSSDLSLLLCCLTISSNDCLTLWNCVSQNWGLFGCEGLPVRMVWSVC